MVVEYGVLWGGYCETALVSLAPLSWSNFRLSKKDSPVPEVLYKMSHLPCSACKECLSKYQHCSPDLLISSFHLWQKGRDAAPGLLKAGGG